MKLTQDKKIWIPDNDNWRLKNVYENKQFN